MLLASAHMGLRAAFSEVTARHSPGTPAHTSGGSFQERRIKEHVRPSAATETAVCSFAVIDSAPVHIRSTCPFSGFNCEMPDPPSRISANTIRPFGGHAIDFTDDGTPGVRLRT